MTENVTVLIVDDEPFNREMVAMMLDESVSILMAENGIDALTQLARYPEVDLILLDLEMPVMDGFCTLEQLKADPLRCDIPVIVITASPGEVTRTLTLGANDFLAKPLNGDELRLRVMNHVRTKKLTDLQKDVNAHLEREVARKTEALRLALAFSRETEYEITLRLGRAAEFRDLETGMHTRRISEMAKYLGELAGCSEEECEVLRYASPLHDVGKVGIPDRILLKPGKLDDSEFQIMKLHTVIGGKILADAKGYPVMEAGRIIALQHHEKWDGTGYPEGLQGEEIHLHGRIVMIVDVFDALCSERPYKPAFPLERTMAIMEESRETFFDPRLLDLFQAHVERFAAIRNKLQDQPQPEPLTEFARYL